MKVVGVLALYYILFIVSIAVHEFGHAFGAWRNGIRVASIAIGKGPGFYVWRGRTTVRLGLGPFGGLTTYHPSAASYDLPHSRRVEISSMGMLLQILASLVGITVLGWFAYPPIVWITSGCLALVLGISILMRACDRMIHILTMVAGFGFLLSCVIMITAGVSLFFTLAFFEGVVVPILLFGGGVVWPWVSASLLNAIIGFCILEVFEPIENLVPFFKTDGRAITKDCVVHHQGSLSKHLGWAIHRKWEAAGLSLGSAAFLLGSMWANIP